LVLDGKNQEVQNEAAVTELKQLMDKRDALKKEELIAAIKRSDKTYEEILEFIHSDL